MSRREQKSWSWILKKPKTGMIVLAKTSSNLTDRPTAVSSEWLAVEIVNLQSVSTSQYLLEGRKWSAVAAMDGFCEIGASKRGQEAWETGAEEHTVLATVCQASTSEGSADSKT
jgi:hypothetical protein